MTVDPPTWEVLALRYGTKTVPRSHNYYRYFTYGEEDRIIGMDFFFWVIRNAGEFILVDTGFSPAEGERRNRTTVVEPLDGLRRLGIRPADIGHVVLTHLHYDHVGNVGAFPNATFSAARRELDFWAGPYGSRMQFASAVAPEEVATVFELERSGRLTAFDDGVDLRPGLQVVRVGGHTAGQSIVDVTSTGGRAVLASDSVHYYEELELDRPGAYVADLADVYRAYDLLKRYAATDGCSIVAGHDPLVLERFPSIDPDDSGFGVQVL